MHHILALSLTLAHAGWFARVCEKLVMTDPYQWEETGEAYLKAEIERLKIRRSWNAATRYELEVLDLMEKELRKRAVIKAL